MTAPRVPLRLVAELLAIVVIAHVAAVLSLRFIAPSAVGGNEALLGAALLALLASPAFYWRSMAASRRALGVVTSATADREPGQRIDRQRAILMTAVAQLVGLALTAAAVLTLERSVEEQARVRFERLAERVHAETRRRLLRPLQGLVELRSLYSATGTLDPEAFRLYIDARNLPLDFPGVRSFTFAERVLRDDLGAFRERMRLAAVPEVASGGSASDLYIIRQVEPRASNLGALGVDIGADPVRREAVERAISRGEPSISRVLRLPQDEAQRPAFVYQLPVYRAGSSPANADERLQHSIGVLSSAVIIEDLLRGIDDAGDRVLDLQLFDAATADVSRLAFAVNHAAVSGAARSYRYAVARPIEVGGRELTLGMASTPAFDAGVDRSSLMLLGFGGVLTSFLLALMVWLLAAGRLRAQALAGRMTADLDRLAKVVERTSNAVVITGADRRIEWVNDGFTRLLGFTRDEARGKLPGDLLASEHTAPAERRRLAQAVAEGRSYRGEIVNRGKDGSHHWLEVDHQTMRDAGGAITGTMTVATDVTAQKRTAEALRSSETLLDRTGRIAGIGGWEFNLATQTVVWSKQTRRLHEVDDDYQPALESAMDFYAPEGRPALQAAMHQALEDGTPYDLTLPFVTARGRSIWVRCIAEGVLVDGKVIRLVGTFQDVTEQHALSADLRRSNQVLQSILDNLPCGLCVIDADLQLLAWNAYFVELLDLPATLFEPPAPSFERVLRYKLQRGDFGPDVDVEAAVAAMRVEARSGSSLLAHEVRLNGRILEVRRAPMPGGGLVTTYTDVTERRRADEAIRDNERFMRIVTHHIPGVVAYWTPDLRCTFANSASKSWLGRSPEEMIGISRLELLGEEMFRRDEACMLAALRGEPQRVERSRRKFDGTEVEYWLHYLPDVDGDTVKGIISVAIDVTEMKQAQRQLESLNLALQERTSQAEQASVAKGRFLATMSHEIRTPMNAILGMLRLLQQTSLSLRQRDYADKAEGAARSLLGLIDDILDFSKAEAGKMVLDARPMQLDRLLRQLSAILAATLGDKPVELVFDIDPAAPQDLIADDLRLQQVLINLGGNAVKFTAAGHVVVSVQLIERRETEAVLEFAVLDTGIGIAAEHHQQVFSGFSQAEASTTRRFGGSGLGLAISQRLVALMGSELQLESTLGRGSRFFFRLTLPLAPAGEAAAPARSLDTLRVLAVDDHPTTLEVLRRQVESLGWRATTAASGEEALERIRNAAAADPFDVCLVDWQMPGIDGWETCRRLRAACRGEAPTLVMLSAHPAEALSADRLAADEALLDGWLVKPVTQSMLFDAVVDARADLPRRAATRSEGPRLAGLRLLVVDDNANNRQIASELLVAEGARVELAVNGAEGVAAVRAAAAPFDAVLMDIQMPVMDGYTATATLRAEPRFAQLPIIAMTANALPADRQACLAAGMNDHVGKPIDLALLIDKLRQQTGRGASAAGAPTGPARDAAPLPLPPDLADEARRAGVELDTALARIGGRADVYSRLLDGFLRELAGYPQQLAAHFASGDAAEARRLMHTLKGLAATLGVARLAAQASAAEARLAEPLEAPAQQAMLADWRAAVDAAAPPLQQIADRLREAPAVNAAGPLDRVALRALLDELRARLDDGDMAAVDSYRRLQRAAPQLAGALRSLDDAMAALDFVRASTECANLAQYFDSEAP